MTGNVLAFPHGSSQGRPAREDRDWVTGPELCTEADITYRQVDYWTRTGLLSTLPARTAAEGPPDANRWRDPDRNPYTPEQPGSGYLRHYPETQIRRAQTIRALLDAGVSLVTCRQVIDQITETGQVRIGAVTLTLHHSTGDPAA